MALYFQCKMRRGEHETVGWIEERGARIGLHVELLSLDGKFWEVTEVWRPGLEERALKAKQARDRNALPSIVGRSK